jgi:putative ATP-dependent endonuclease of OLD family
MRRLKSVTIKNYKSIGEEEVKIDFPENQPVILIGENNSGKTNIIRAIDILFGETYPKYRSFEDHDFFAREREKTIIIKAEVEGMRGRLGKNEEFTCSGFKLKTSKGNNEDNDNGYCAIQLEDGKEINYVSNKLREEFFSILIESRQSLAYQLSYASKYTLLSKVTKTFHSKLTSSEDRVNKLKKIYNQVLEIFDEVDEFKEFKQKMSSLTGELIHNMSYALRLDFSAYDPSNYFKNIQVLPYENESPRSFEELGTGQQQILMLSFAHAYARCFKEESNLILMFDEPETNLHPLAQRWLAKTLFNMSKEDGIQIVITTHSPNFINLEFLEGIYLVRKIEDATRVINQNRESFAKYCTEKGAKKIKSDSVVPYYTKSATVNIIRGFFAKKIVLVEGPTEELALPIYLEKEGFDILKEGIDIIGVLGKGELAKWWRLFTAYKIPCYVCFDNDKGDDDKGEKRRDFLNAVGIQENEQENILKTDKWIVNKQFCVFGINFENALKNCFAKYKEIEETVKAEFGNSKPIVAREVAKKLSNEYFNKDDKGWENIKRLIEYLRELSI